MCMIDGADSTCSVYRTKNVRARKPHRCDECNRKIPVGEQYDSTFLVVENEPMSFAMCAHCAVAARWLKVNCGGFLHEGVWEDMNEHRIDYPNLADDLAKLCDGIRSGWEGLEIPSLPQPISVSESPTPTETVGALS